MKRTFFAFIVVFFAVFAATSCNQSTENQTTTTDTTKVADTVAAEPEWLVLFDGTSANGWRGYNKDHFPTGWEVVDGMLHCKASGRGEAGSNDGGDVIYEKKFSNFELSLEWKISVGGNSGIFYLAQEVAEQAIWQSAPEMQVLDNVKHIDGKDEIHCAGALYDLIGVAKNKPKPVGEWNEAKVIVFKGTVQHWLNGEKVVEYHLWTPEWNEMVAKSKFVKFNPKWAEVATEGLIGLQDHGDDVWYRNIKIKELL